MGVKANRFDRERTEAAEGLPGKSAEAWLDEEANRQKTKGIHLWNAEGSY